jgi:hypothetical protein
MSSAAQENPCLIFRVNTERTFKTMGMYDEVRIPKLYCYHCGADLVDRFWQSKSGDCVLKQYNSLEEFGAEFYRLAAFQLVEICPECKEFLEVELRNPSEEHRVYLAERDKEWRAGLIEEQTAKHPNHDFGSYNGTGDVFYTNAWCRTCQEKGYAKSRENPEMSLAHIVAGKIWASQQIDEKHRKRRQAGVLGTMRSESAYACSSLRSLSTRNSGSLKKRRRIAIV